VPSVRRRHLTRPIDGRGRDRLIRGFLSGSTSIPTALPSAPLLCRPSGYAELKAGRPRVPGVRDELVGIIARREAGTAAAARKASTTRDDEEMTVADSIMAVQNPDATAFSTGHARRPAQQRQSEHALPVPRLVRRCPSLGGNYSDR
jgi:hypothetical protein